MPVDGRVIDVEVDRLPGWVERFGGRHGRLTIAIEDACSLVITAADGARAELAIPFRPMPENSDEADLVARLVEHVREPRTIGILLVRRGGWAAGVVESGALVAAAVGGGHVQGRTKAGGWSQQRYARRRANQARQVWQRAAAGAAAVLLPGRERLTALVTGGDRVGVAEVLEDPRLSWLVPLVEPRLVAVGDPSRSVLADVAHRLDMITVRLNALA